MTINSNSIKYIKIYGGVNKIIKKNIDNQVLNKIKNKCIDHKLFKKNYYIKDNAINVKYIELLKMHMYDILPLNNKIYNSFNTCFEKIKYTHSLSYVSIINLLIDYFKLNDNKIMSYEILFHSYKNMIEKLIEIFIKLKNDDISNIRKEWCVYNNKNNINTSSVLLYFLFNKHNSINYNLSTISFENNIINTKINIFLDKLNKINYRYLEFCPHYYENRLQSILSFPIEELIDCIKSMDKNNNYVNKYKIIYELKIYIKKNKINIKKLNNSISEIIDDINNIEINKKKNTFVNNNISDIPLINIYTDFIEYMFYIYKSYLPYLLEIEDNHYKLSIEIDNIINILNKI